MVIICIGRKILWDYFVIIYYIVLNIVYLYVLDDIVGIGKWRKFFCMYIYLCNGILDLRIVWSKLIVCLNRYYINLYWGVGCF